MHNVDRIYEENMARFLFPGSKELENYQVAFQEMMALLESLSDIPSL